MPPFVKYLIVAAAGFGLLEYFHPFSPTTYTQAAFQEITKEADRLLGRESYAGAKTVLASGQKTGNLDVGALGKALEPTAKKSESLAEIYNRLAHGESAPAQFDPRRLDHSSRSAFDGKA
jgi:hypothetical protein